MKKENTNSFIKVWQEDWDKPNNKINKQLDIKILSGNKRSREDLIQKKRIIKKEDGRYLIYYDF